MANLYWQYKLKGSEKMVCMADSDPEGEGAKCPCFDANKLLEKYQKHGKKTVKYCCEIS